MAEDNLEERSVEVLEIPDNVDDDLLLLYFENKRSGGGSVIFLERSGDRALLVFEQPEAAARVVSKDSHSLNNVRLIVRRKPPKDRGKFLLRGVSPSTSPEMVELFVENLMGVDSDDYSLYPSAGKDLVLINLHTPLSQDFQKISEKFSKKTLDGAKVTLEQVEHTDSVLVENLPPSVMEDMLMLYFESSRSGGGEVMDISRTAGGSTKITFKDVECVDRVLQKSHKLEETDLIIKPFFSFLEAEGIEAPVSLQNRTNQLSDDQNQTGGNSLTSLNGSDLMTSASPQPSQTAHRPADSSPEPQQSPSAAAPAAPAASLSTPSSPVTATAVADAEKDAMEVGPSGPEPLACQISVSDPTKLQLIGLSSLLDDLKKAHPNYGITLAQDGVHIKGQGGLEAEHLRSKLLEFLSGFSQMHLPLNALKGQLLEKKSVKDKTVELLKEQGLPSVYTVSDGAVIVTSPTMQMVSQACETIKRSVVETSLPVKPKYESMLYSLEFQVFVQSLDMCCAEITDFGATVTVVTLKGLEEDMKQVIIEFLSTPVQKEEVLSMEPAMLNYIQLHHQQLLSDMNQLTILPLETGDGLMIQGNASECQMAAEVLGSVVSSTHTKIITVTQPGIARFLREGEGTSILGEMTTKFQVYISLEKVHWKPLEDEDIFELAWKMTSGQNFSRDSSAQALTATESKTSNTTAADEYTTARIEEARRILSVIERSSEPSSLRVTDMEQEEDLYSEPSADQTGDSAPMQAEESSGATDLGELFASNPCSLDEDAELLLAIQMSMEANQRSDAIIEEDLQKVLELSRGETMLVDESQMLEKAVDDSLQETIKSANVAEIKVFASYTHDLIRVDIALGKKVGLRQCEEKVEHKSLRKLSVYFKRCMDLVKRKHAVEIQVQGTTAIVSGFKDYVSEALPDLKEVLKRAANSTTDAEVLKTVQWVRTDQGGSGAVPYPPDVTVFIENAWRMKRRKIDIVFDNQPHTIDLEKMQEHSVSSGRCVAIARKMVTSENLITELQDDYSLLSDVPDTCRVDEASDEFQDVVREFYDSIHEYHNKIKIIKVEKMMNSLLYNQYRLKKASMEQSATNPQVERTLFHGTSEISVKEICVHGFNRSFCGKNATVYGQGVYFAVESALSVSDTYSPPNADGHKFIFMARVLTGDFTVGKHEMKAAPLKDTSGIPVRYHSVVDKLDSPTLFVIFNDTQAYPQYLITCQKVYG
ncbi:protein mono-ADP-ribosyltransferase PARP10 [Pygocentrus nattereri]|nr:protein mono-ADP-ribosyltransferase PARP10 [Pygocentrus nattereri]XP_017572429.1 protein mono-ADP-ribosyltransferase PARP10 [Pygocentrus nattereri]